MKLSEAKINTILIDDEIILSSDLLSLYMKSVQSERNINKTKHTPIFFPTALVFGEIFKKYSLPDGTIHLSQKIEFSDPIQQNSKIHAFAEITKNLIRSGNRLISININIYNSQKSLSHKSQCNLLIS
tara:strand:- start:984 stop:1367 length:384 start_codon:yes stop_codon:yes gene_type:complete